MLASYSYTWNLSNLSSQVTVLIWTQFEHRSVWQGKVALQALPHISNGAINISELFTVLEVIMFLHSLICGARVVCCICSLQMRTRTKRPSHCRRLPWDWPGPVPQRRSQGEVSSPPQEEGRRSKSRRGCALQCASMDATILDATCLLPTSAMGDGPTRTLQPSRALARLLQQKRRARQGQQGGQLGRKWRNESMQDALKGRNRIV